MSKFLRHRTADRRYCKVCRKVAQWECERCGRPLCLKHVKITYGKKHLSRDFCPDCAEMEGGDE